MFKKRIGPDPHADGGITPGTPGCPDIWELENGDFAIIGENKTGSLAPKLPDSASCGPEEDIVVIPRRTLVNAKSSIPPS
jgi:hypothetical protein